MALKKDTPNGAEKPRAQTPVLLPVKTAIAPAAQPEPEYAWVTELKAKRDKLITQKEELERYVPGRPYIDWTVEIKALNEEINQAIAKINAAEVDRRFYDFKPCVDPEKAYRCAADNRLKGHLDYIYDLVDDVDKRIICDAVELLKQVKGGPDQNSEYPEAGDLIKAILMVIGAAEPAKEPA